MSGKFGRSSKFRHVFGEPPKIPQRYTDLQKPLASGEGYYVAANDKYFAVGRDSGGGPVLVRPFSKTGRIERDAKLINVQKGKALDFHFHPFINTMLATASEDATVAVTKFPEGGLTEDITKADVMLSGHSKKLTLCQFHPTANSILASAGYDRCVKLWNIETAQNIYSYDTFGDNIFSMVWNRDGSLLGCSSKDKRLRLIDPRQDEAKCAMEGEGFLGSKTNKLFWIPAFNWIGGIGFSKQAKREVRLWDLKNLAEPIFSWEMDTASAILYPHFDPDTGVLFLAGKGDSSVTYFEILNDARKLYLLSKYVDTTPQKGGGWGHKLSFDTTRCEIARYYKMTRDAIIPISFMVPRKTGGTVFQEDIFPDTIGATPAMTAEEYVAGENRDPIMVSMNPAKRTESGGGAVFAKKKTYDELRTENEQMAARIQDLEAQLAAANPAPPQAEPEAAPEAAPEAESEPVAEAEA